MKGTLFLLLLVLLAALGLAWFVRDMFSATTFEKKYETQQIDAVIAACRADTIGEAVPNRCTACNWIVDVMLRQQEALEKKNPDAKVSFLQMLHTGAPFYPDGWVHEGLFFGRSVNVIWVSPRYLGSSWNDMKKCVLDKLQKGIDRTRCAIKYVRADKRYSSTTDEGKAAGALTSSMKVDPKQPPELKMQFLCPPPKKQSFLPILPPAFARVVFD